MEKRDRASRLAGKGEVLVAGKKALSTEPIL